VSTCAFVSQKVEVKEVSGKRWHFQFDFLGGREKQYMKGGMVSSTNAIGVEARGNWAIPRRIEEQCAEWDLA